MADDARQYPPPPLPSRLGMRHHVSTAAATDATIGGCGEIVEVQGGHIVRSTGRKDRHSKVCTAKGPRDRRVRLSAHTAIQFYDVQDRLGFDRPSKAVDWLIKKAKTSIDELAELPPWNPVDAIRHAAANAKPRRTSKSLISQQQQIEEQQQQQQQQQQQNLQFDVGASVPVRGSVCPPAIGFHQSNDNESSFLPPSMDSDSIADTIKSFFPVASTEAPSSQQQQQLIQNYHQHHHHPPQPPPDLLSRTNSQNQDLRLSLQSFHDNPPLLLHQQHASSAAAEPVLFYGQSNLGYDTSTVGWENSHHHQSPEFGRIQRLVAWNSGGAADTGNGGSGGGFLFASPSTATTFQPVFGQSQLFSQRGPLQSSYTPMIRACFDPHHHHNHHNHHQSISTATTTDDLNHHQSHSHHMPAAVHQSAIPGIGFASGEFPGFRIPARFQGEEEEHDGINNKPSSASSISRH